jgi:hypothetical protein
LAVACPHFGWFARLSGKGIAVTGIGIFCIVDGKLAELWLSWEQLDMMRLFHNENKVGD